LARTSHTDVSLWFVLDSDTPDAITPDPHERRSVRWWFPKEVRAGDPGSFDPHLVRMLDKFDALLPGGGSGLVGPRAGWATTTHDWSLDVDENHLWDVLERWATFGAGGAAHLVLEVLAYADDEATALGARATAPSPSTPTGRSRPPTTAAEPTPAATGGVRWSAGP